MTAAIASFWMMEKNTLVRKASPIPSTANGFGGACFRWTNRLKRKSSIAAIPNGALSAVRFSCLSPIGQNTVRTVPKMSTANKKPPASENGGQSWTNRPRKSPLYQGFPTSEHDHLMVLHSPPLKMHSKCLQIQNLPSCPLEWIG